MMIDANKYGTVGIVTVTVLISVLIWTVDKVLEMFFFLQEKLWQVIWKQKRTRS